MDTWKPIYIIPIILGLIPAVVGIMFFTVWAWKIIKDIYRDNN